MVVVVVVMVVFRLVASHTCGILLLTPHERSSPLAMLDSIDAYI